MIIAGALLQTATTLKRVVLYPRRKIIPYIFGMHIPVLVAMQSFFHRYHYILI